MKHFSTPVGREKALTTHQGGAVVYAFPSSKLREALETVRLADDVIQEAVSGMSPMGAQLFEQAALSYKPTDYFSSAYQDLHDARNLIYANGYSHGEVLAMLHGFACAAAETLAAIPDAQNEWAAADNLRDLLANRRDGA